MNQYFLDRDSSQSEALPQPHQSRASSVIVDDCAIWYLGIGGNRGGQRLIIDDVSYPMHFYGCKCRYWISKPSEEYLSKYNIVELISPLAYEPQRQRHCWRMIFPIGSSTEGWRSRLGYPTLEVMKNTLQNTINMITTLQSETRDYRRDYYKTCVWSLRPRRIDNVCYLNTFVSSMVSIRGLKCFQNFAFKASCYKYIELMKHKAEVPDIYEDALCEVGAPNKTVTDNVKVLTEVK